MPEMKVMLFRTTRIRVDAEGRVCLNDIHAAAGFSVHQTPADWLRLPNATREIEAVLRRNTGKSRLWTKEEINSTYYSRRGQGGGTWADENIALGYAAYLSPDLAVEIRESGEALPRQIPRQSRLLPQLEGQRFRFIG